MTSKLQKICEENDVQYDGAISLDGEQLGDMSIQLIDDIVYNKFQFYYKGKPVKFKDIKITVHGGFDE
jgi:hypothetical protein